MSVQTEEKKRPEISVIVPVYNVAPYLSACLDSVLAQTFRDFELILVEDGSTDGSREIEEAYAAKDARVRLVKRRWNHGAAPSCIRHLNHSRELAKSFAGRRNQAFFRTRCKGASTASCPCEFIFLRGANFSVGRFSIVTIWNFAMHQLLRM